MRATRSDSFSDAFSRSFARSRLGVVTTVALLAALVGFAAGQAQERSRAERIVGVYGVGGVIGDDGSLWQYMPDQKRWMTIDEAFKGEGRQTKVLPLPAAPEDIRFMESWGFLVTHKGDVWHYDLEANRWENIGAP